MDELSRQPETLLDQRVVAARLGLSLSTIRQYVHFGILSSVRVGRRRLVRSSVLCEIIENGLTVDPSLKRTGWREPATDRRRRRKLQM